MNPPQQEDEADDTAMTAQLQSDSILPGGRSDTTPIDSTHAEGGNDDTSATPLQTPSLTCTPSASFYEERFQSTYVEDCADINDFLQQLYFWRALMNQNGKDIEDSYLIKLILARLPSEYNEPRSFYTSMLHSYALCGKVTLGEVDRGLRFFGNLLQDKRAKTEAERKALREVRAKASSQLLNVGFLEHGLKFTHLGDCHSVEDYLGRMYFWRRSLKEHGKKVGNSTFLEAMIKGLTVHYRKIGAHYLMLRCTPALNNQTLEEFASRLLAIEEEIHSFNRDRKPNLIELILGDLRYRWGPADVVEIDWKLKSYFVLTGVSFAMSIMMLIPATRPFQKGIQLAVLGLWLVGLLLVSRHLIRHLIFLDFRPWGLLDACDILAFICLGLFCPFACLSLAFIVHLPLIVLKGIAIAKARGRVRGCRKVKLQ